jgi:hypothetical protein
LIHNNAFNETQPSELGKLSGLEYFFLEHWLYFKRSIALAKSESFASKIMSSHESFLKTNLIALTIDCSGINWK